MRFVGVTVALSALLVGLLLADCGRSGSGEPHAVKSLLPDDQIRESVVKRFAENPRLKGLHIAVVVRSGTVVLSGPVPSDQVKIEAADTARDVAEIAGVDSDQLVVQQR